MRTRWRSIALGSVALSAALVAGQAAWSADADPTAIVVVVPTEPDTLEPCESSNESIGRVVKLNVNETLLDIDPADGKLLPRLATSWEQRDPQTWRFKLVENAKFTDGEPFNADAVVFNITRAFNKKLGCSMISKAFAGFNLTAAKVDDYTVDIKADKPAPILATGFGVLTMVSPKTPMDEAARNAAGTGPYKFVEWVAGDKVVLERNDDYWGAKPEVSKVSFVFRPESAVRAAMSATGEADIAVAITEQDANSPATDFSYLDSETTWLRIDTRYAPMDDVRFRKALNYAVDREAMLGTVVSAEAIPAAQLPVPGISGHDDSLKPFPYDPEKAKALLAEAKAAGVPVDTKIRFIARSAQFAQVDEFAQALTAMFQDVGLDVELEMMERGRQNRFQAKPLPTDVGPNIMLIMSDNNLGDAGFSVYNYHSDGTQSTTMIPELDAMINKTMSATGDERQKGFHEIFRRALDEYATMVPLFHMTAVTRVSERLDWKPTITTNSQIDVQKMKFKKS
jgi:peptide/nickel transport system substrate-binding protein